MNFISFILVSGNSHLAYREYYRYEFTLSKANLTVNYAALSQAEVNECNAVNIMENKIGIVCLRRLLYKLKAIYYKRIMNTAVDTMYEYICPC